MSGRKSQRITEVYESASKSKSKEHSSEKRNRWESPAEKNKEKLIKSVRRSLRRTNHQKDEEDDEELLDSGYMKRYFKEMSLRENLLSLNCPPMSQEDKKIHDLIEKYT